MGQCCSVKRENTYANIGKGRRPTKRPPQESSLRSAKSFATDEEERYTPSPSRSVLSESEIVLDDEHRPNHGKQVLADSAYLRHYDDTAQVQNAQQKRTVNLLTTSVKGSASIVSAGKGMLKEIQERLLNQDMHLEWGPLAECKGSVKESSYIIIGCLATATLKQEVERELQAYGYKGGQAPHVTRVIPTESFINMKLVQKAGVRLILDGVFWTTKADTKDFYDCKVNEQAVDKVTNMLARKDGPF